LIWDPLEKEHLAGANLVIVSPDGVVGRVPLAALPGARPGTYLIEDRPLAVAPVPQLLPQILRDQPTAARDGAMLLVGGVDFGGRRPALEGTREEVETIGRIYSSAFQGRLPTVLGGAIAQKPAFVDATAGQRYLHLATHGYFRDTPPRELAAMDPQRAWDTRSLAGNAMSLNPGLLSGIVFAGSSAAGSAPGTEGVLTAGEVTELDLSGAEMAVLSACETGLGPVAGGEGTLGLQRAFALAGARSVVSSLWRVHDTATSAMMERFYENLWVRKMGKLEALREAQLWMLREGRVQLVRRHGAQRGLGESRPLKDLIDSHPTKLPPYYWAGFTLSGDWR
jgi:CHAT domain-containing protein